MPSLGTYLLVLSLLLFLGCSKDQEAEAFSSVDSEETPTEEKPPILSSKKADGDSGIYNPPVGKQRFWSFATGHRADLDRAYANQPVNILTNAFGMPLEKRTQGTDTIWLYDKMKVAHQGTNYSRVNVIVRQGRVMKITVDPSSAQKNAVGNTSH